MNNKTKVNKKSKEEDVQKCAKCNERGIICEFIPCHHKLFCMVCLEEIRKVTKKCSLCSQKVLLIGI